MKRKKLWSVICVATLLVCLVRIVLLACFAYAAAECIHHNATVERCGANNPVGQAFSDTIEILSSYLEGFFMVFAVTCILQWRQFNADNFIHELPHTPLFWSLLAIGSLSCVMTFFVRFVNNKSMMIDMSNAWEIGFYVVATTTVQFIDVPLLRADAAFVAAGSPSFTRLTTTAWFCFLLTTLLRLALLLGYDAMSAARVLKVTPVGSTNEFDAILLVIAVALRGRMLTEFYTKVFEWRTPQEKRVVCGSSPSIFISSLTSNGGHVRYRRLSSYEEIDSGGNDRRSNSPIALCHPASGDALAKDTAFASASTVLVASQQVSKSDPSQLDAEREPLLVKSTSSSGTAHDAVPGTLLYA